MKKIDKIPNRLKIIEQIAIVFFIGVIIPVSISGFVINNINQQSIRRQLRESAILIAGVVSDEVAYTSKSNESTLSQISETLNYLTSDKVRQEFIKSMSKRYPQCDSISVVKKKTDVENIKNNLNPNEKTVLSSRLKNGEYLVLVFNNTKLNSKIFQSLNDNERQIYLMDFTHKVLASHNYNEKSYREIVDSLPEKLEEKQPTIFGEEKNRPAVYYKNSDPDYIVVVNTTDYMSKQAIYNNRVKIILSVIAAIGAMMVLIGFYIYYLYINIRQLFKAIIATSKGNYQRQIRLISTTFTPYEIIFLATEFNNMVSEIHESYLELQKKNKELKELNEFRSNLIDTVSHELRTPLTSIQGYTSRLMRQDIVIDEETKQKSLRVIKQQSERLKRLIDDLLTIPDIEGTRLRTNNTEVSLHQVLEQTELLLRKHDGHEIIVKISDDFPTVYADKGRLEQVFVNLYENAVKYAYPETPIIVDVTEQDGFAVVTVKNQCDMISQSKLNSLFGKFVRMDDNMTRTTRGTGLGLFIVKGLIEAMEGSIHLSSTNEYGFIAEVKVKLYNSSLES